MIVLKFPEKHNAKQNKNTKINSINPFKLCPSYGDYQPEDEECENCLCSQYCEQKYLPTWEEVINNRFDLGKKFKVPELSNLQDTLESIDRMYDEQLEEEDCDPDKIESYRKSTKRREENDHKKEIYCREQKEKDYVVESFQTINKELKTIRIEYAHHFDSDGKWPHAWMRKDKGVAVMIGRTKFCEVLNYLWRSATKSATFELSELMPTEKRYINYTFNNGKTRSCPKVLLQIDFERASKVLEMPVKTLKKYITQFHKAGIIKNEGKPGSRESVIWSIGVWIKYQGETIGKRLPYLVETDDFKKKLAEMRF